MAKPGSTVPRGRASRRPVDAGYVLMLILGLRRGEPLGLACDDIDLEAEEVHIAWQLRRIKR